MPTVKRSMTPFEWWWVVLAFLFWILFIARTAGGAEPATEDRDVTLRGRVVDEEGRPIAGAVISAAAPAMGHQLWWAQLVMTHALSDDEGRYELSLPFRDVLYSVNHGRMGYHGSTLHVLPEADAEDVQLDITLRPGTHAMLLGRVNGPDGKPAGNLDLTLVGEYHFTATTRTAADGSYRFFEIPSYIGQAVLVARSGEFVIPQQIVRGGDADVKESNATLAPAGRLEGVVIDQTSEQPVSNAMVTIRPWFSSGFQLQTRCNAEGEYAFEAVPPGGYLVEATAAQHFDKPPRGETTARERVEVVSGQATLHDIPMRGSAIVRGRVLGPDGQPVPGAAVCMPVGWSGDYRDRNRYVRTDADGNFEIVTGHIEDEGLAISAFSARSGLGHVQFESLGEAEVREGFTMKLPGAVRVRGTVTGGQDQGIAHVICATGAHEVGNSTDDQGRFDLGRVTKASDPKHQPAVHFRTPRPATVNGVVWSDRGKIDPDSRAYFEDVTVPFDDQGSDAVDLKVALTPTDQLFVEGCVVDARGEPAQKVNLYLFAGNANDDTWADQVLPRFDRGDFKLMNFDKLLSGATASPDGRFRLRTVRFDGEATDDGTRYSIGIVVGDQGVKLIKDVTFPLDVLQRELSISLD